ncbi:hypothetical protein, partial [Acidovorax sp. K2F]|uniref:hypothetical protein n=1 Tax=Acidovorax sp. K2F TaxID=2978125 RepID=UPI0021B1087E
MNAATLSAQPVTAAKASLRTGNAAPQAANPMQEIDQLIQPVARQIAVLLRPLTDGWTWGAEFPGKS